MPAQRITRVSPTISTPTTPPASPAAPSSTDSASTDPFPIEPEAWARVVESLALSPQQARIVELLIQGRRDKQIARELGLGIPTVRTYLTRIFQKAGVQDRLELIVRVFVTARKS